MPYKERRAFERVGSSAPLTLALDRDLQTPFTATSKNISTGSICFETDAPLETDDRITLQLQTIFGPVSVSAVIVRKKEKIYGCRFADVKADVAEKIRSWLYPPFEP